MPGRSCEFVWTDLSSYHVPKSSAFYADSFEWQIPLSQNDKYHIATIGGTPAAALYEMPETYQKKGFPPFWMSYIQVPSVENSIKLALELGGQLEMGPIEVEGGCFALIRDPLGAGFSLYQSAEDYTPAKGNNTVQCRELHISNLKSVQAFYEKLFNWSIEKSAASPFQISNSDRIEIGTIRELPHALRAGYEYWIPVFQVANLQEYMQKLRKLGGIVYQVFDQRIAMVTDPYGASFMVVDH